jgi:putative PEP-CTERM system integral membrane protein
MAENAEQVTQALARLEDLHMNGAAMDVYLTASPFRGEPPRVVSLVEVQLGELFYFGGQNAAELLAQYAALSQGRGYDAVLVLTDGSGYELGEAQVDVPIPEAPVWMVHLTGDLPLGYDDRTLEVIQASGGGVAADIDQALTRLASGLSGEKQGLPAGAQDVLDGYLWSVLPTQDVQAALEQIRVQPDDGGFGALAARRWILAEMARQRGSIEQLETLDQLHALAKEYGIVTPYSSMIVLVDQQQERTLDRLEEQADRYDREVEAVGDTAPPVETPLSGVPEPEEWLLLSLAAAMLAWYAYRRRLARQAA